MKSYFYAAGLAVALMSSCSNESDVNLPVGDLEKDLMPVSLGLNMSSANVEESRSTGTVGGTTDGENVWRYENLYVLMTTSDKDALEDKNAEWGFTSVCGTVLKEQFDNTFYSRPEEVDRNGTKVWSINYKCDPNEGGNMKYYPAQGKSDFFAYYVDDAAKADAKGNPEYKIENNQMYVPFEITGSQDLLTGKADVAQTGTEGGFSAKTARANIIPQLKMEHMLTRLTFTLKNGNAHTANVKVKSIFVESKYQGNLYVAYKTAPAEVITFTDKYAKLYLKQEDPNNNTSSLATGKCPLVDFVPITMNGVDDVDAGEALLVCPGETVYKMYVEMEHAINVNGEDKVEPVTLPLDLKLADGKAFEKGKSYHVNATIYGLEDIKIEAQLEKWTDGGDINVGSDNLGY